jgi:hypothetical protein
MKHLLFDCDNLKRNKPSYLLLVLDLVLMFIILSMGSHKRRDGFADRR